MTPWGRQQAELALRQAEAYRPTTAWQRQMRALNVAQIKAWLENHPEEIAA
jgi:hypothetical protein